MNFHIGCIVEGKGETVAVPLLLRRILQNLDPGHYVANLPHIQVGRQKLVQEGELERHIERLARMLARPRAILVLIDADDDCPRDLGPSLLARAKQARPDIPIGVVLAKREYEAWFLAAIESLSGKKGFAEDLQPVDDPEEIQGAKERLGREMTGRGSYRPTRHQASLTAIFDMQLARQRSDSFDKCWREVERLVEEASEARQTG